MRFDDLQPCALPPAGAIVAEWCDKCRGVQWQYVNRSRRIAGGACLFNRVGALASNGRLVFT